MKFYKITNNEGDDKPDYQCTKIKGHDKMKETAEEASEPGAIRMELVEIVINQENIASILSGWGANETVLETWALTNRGGLKSVANGE